MNKFIFFIFSILVCNSFIASGSLYELSIDNRVSSSSLIVEGEVIEQQSFWNSQHTRIYTSNKVRITRLLKGQFSSNYIYIQTEGGIVGNEMQTISSLLDLIIGERGFFFCNPSTKDQMPLSNISMFEVYGSKQGFLKYLKNGEKLADPFHIHNLPIIESTIKRHTGSGFTTLSSLVFNYPSVKVLNILSFSPATITAGTKSVLTITGTDFGTSGPSSVDYVEFPDANYGGGLFYQTDLGDYISWSDTLIQLYVPSRAGTGQFNVVIGSNSITSSSALNIPYSQINTTDGTNMYKPYKIDDNGAGGYTWTKSTNFSIISHQPAFDRALDTWKCATGVNWEISTITTSTNVSGADGINVVGINSSLPAGVLGRCTSYFQSCNGGTEWYVTELDIIFDSGTLWHSDPGTPASNRYDFETVALHELGHGHELGHVIITSDMMYYALAAGDFNRTLSYNNISAGTHVMGQSIVTNNCSQQPMILNFPGQCAPATANDGAIYASNPLSNDVCVGNHNVFADLYNFGSDTIFNTTIEWSVNNYVKPSYNWIGVLAPGQSDQDIIIANDYFGDSLQEVKIWVSEVNSIQEINVVNDTASYTFQPFNTPASIQPFTASNNKDTICYGYSTYTSLLGETGVSYSLNINDSIVGGPYTGSGGNIILHTGSLLETTPIEVVGTSTNICDTVSFIYYDTVVVAPSPIDPFGAFVFDTVICPDDSSFIVIPNSLIGLNYQLIIDGLYVGGYVSGNGDSIYLPTGPISEDAIVTFDTENILGCAYTANDTVLINVDEVVADVLLDEFQFIGDTIVLINNSLADDYVWDFGIGGIANSDSVEQPIAYYTVPGVSSLTLIATNNVGCPDTLTREISVINAMPGGQGASCFDSVLNEIGYSNGFANYEVLDVHVDEFNNTYTVGTKITEISNKLFYSYFLWKFNEDGDTLLNKEYSGPISYVFGTKQSIFFNTITTDQHKNMYIGGCFGGFDSINVEGLNLPSPDAEMTGFLLKMDSTGQGLWGITYHSYLPNRPLGVTDIIYKNENEIYHSILGKYVEGEFQDTSGVALGRDMILVQVNSSGNYIRHLEGGQTTNVNDFGVVGIYNFNYSTTYYEQITTVSPKLHLAKNGELYVVGNIYKTPTFGNYTIGNSSTTAYNGFLAIVDTSFQWKDAIMTYKDTRTAGKAGSGSGRTIKTRKPTYAFDSDDNLYLYINWATNNHLVWYDIEIMDTSFSSQTGSALYKINTDLDKEWIKYSNDVVVTSMGATQSDELLFFGEFSEKFWFDSTSYSSYGLKAIGNKDMMFGAFDTLGNAIWAKNMGSENHDFSTAMGVNECGKMSMFGVGYETFSFGGSTFNIPSTSVIHLDYSASGICNAQCPRFDAIQHSDSTFCLNEEIPLYWDNYSANPINIYVSLDSGSTYTTLESNYQLQGDLFNYEPNDSLYSGQWVLIKSESMVNNYQDSIWVFLNPVSGDVNLGADTVLCPFETLTLNAGGGFADYIWNTTDSIQIIEVDSSNAYSVITSDIYDCKRFDTINVSVLLYPDLLDSILKICPYDTVLLTPSIYESYIWNTGDTTNNLAIDSFGDFSIQVVDSNECLFMDSIEVIELFFNYVLPEVDTLCEGDPLVLTAGGPGYNYLWQSDLGNVWGNETIQVNYDGTFSVTITSPEGCVYYDTCIVTSIDCSTGMQDFQYGENVMIYPNPFYNSLTIDNLEEKLNYEISIISVEGSIVQKWNSNNTRSMNLDISQLSSGVYYLFLKNEKIMKKIKVVKQ